MSQLVDFWIIYLINQLVNVFCQIITPGSEEENEPLSLSDFNESDYLNSTSSAEYLMEISWIVSEVWPVKLGEEHVYSGRHFYSAKYGST